MAAKPTAEQRLADVVRGYTRLGRILPLGGAGDGSWIAESAAAAVLRRAAESVGAVRIRSLRISLSGEPEESYAPAGPQEPASAPPRVPPPASALPAEPLRVELSFDVTADEPLPVAADRVRAAVTLASDERIGLRVTAVDVKISGLVDEVEQPGPARQPSAEPSREPAAGPAQRPSGEAREEPGSRGPGGSRAVAVDPAEVVARAALAVPGVARLDPGPGLPLGPAPGYGAAGVSLRATAAAAPGRGGEAAGPGRHVQIRLIVTAGHRPLDVALAVRTAVAAAVAPEAPGPVTVAVLVTSLDG